MPRLINFLYREISLSGRIMITRVSGLQLAERASRSSSKFDLGPPDSTRIRSGSCVDDR